MSQCLRFPTMCYVRLEKPQISLRICLSLEYSMIVKLLTEHHLEFLSLKGGCTGSSEYTHVKMPHFRKSHATAHVISFEIIKGIRDTGTSPSRPSLICNMQSHNILANICLVSRPEYDTE